MKKNEMAQTQAQMGATESAMELTFAAMNKAFGSVFQETMKFKQALRIFDGMPEQGKKLKTGIGSSQLRSSLASST